jgi:inosine/xanthosine triphosphate pyrophosphatase family protein
MGSSNLFFWVKEANSVYGELSQSQLNKLGSRGKAAKIMSPFLKKEIGLS